MIFIKIVLALVSVTTGIIIMVTTWKKFRFFVPKRDSWTKSPLEQFGLKLGKSVTWGIGGGLLLYVLGDIFLEKHFPAYARSQIKNTADEPASAITAAQDSNEGDRKEPEHDSNVSSPALAPPKFKSTPPEQPTNPVPDVPAPSPVENSETGNQVNKGAIRALQAAMIGERYPETRLEEIDANFTRKLGDAELRYAINEMFARHGAVFAQQEIDKVFRSMTWYHPEPGLSFDQIESLRFTELEKVNLKVLGMERAARKR